METRTEYNFQGRQGGFHGQAQFSAAGVLGKLGRAQTNDGGAAGDIGFTHCLSLLHSGQARHTRTVPVTWLPKPFLPLRVTSTLRSLSRLSVTLPLSVMLSPG